MAKLAQVRIGGFSKNQQSVILPREGARINADGSFLIAGLRPGRIYFSLGGDPKAGGFSIKRTERNGALAQDGIEIGPGENLSDVRVIVGHGNLTLRGEVKVIGGSLPPHIGIYVNLNRVNESESGSALGAFVDGRGQFMFQNLFRDIHIEFASRLPAPKIRGDRYRLRPVTPLLGAIQGCLCRSDQQPKSNVDMMYSSQQNGRQTLNS